MPHPCPHHCPSPGRGSGWIIAVIVVVILLVARPVAHAAMVLAQVLVIALASAAGLAAAGAVTWLAVRHHRRRRVMAALPARTVRALPVAPAAIEAPRPALHLVTDLPERDAVRRGREAGR